MKPFLKHTLLFVPFAVLVYILLLMFWGSNIIPEIAKPNLKYPIASFGHTFSRLNEAKETHNIDVLFIGSSHAYRGFDTRLYEAHGLTAFNLGSSSQTPLQTRALLERYLNQLNPRILIYEVYPITFSIDGVESSLDVIANDRNDMHSLKMAVAMNHAKVWNTFVYGVIRDQIGLNNSIQQPRRLGKDTYIKGGFVERDIYHFRHEEYAQTQWEFNEDQYHEFETILSILRKKKIPVILVNAPVTSSYYASHTNNDDFDSLMSHYGTYYNFNELLTLDDSLHFYDSHHLNQEGVDLFNQRLIDLFFEKKLFRTE